MPAMQNQDLYLGKLGYYLFIYLSNEGNHGPGSLSVFYVFVAEEADEKFFFACEGGFFWLVIFCIYFIGASLK